MKLKDQEHRHFFWLTLLCIAVPGFAAVKALLIFATWLFLLLAGRFKLRSGLWLCSVVMILIAWSEISISYGFALGDILNHGSRIWLFFIVLAIGAFVAGKGRVSATNLDNLSLAIATLAMLLKVIIVAGVLSGRFTLDQVQSALGFQTVSETIGLGLQRLQFPSDIIIVFLLACYVGGTRKWKDLLFLVSILIVVLLSFSRFLFAAFLLCTLIRALWVRKSDFFSWTAIAITVIAAAVFSASLVTRFAGRDTSSSDQTRVQQVAALDNAINAHPLLGTGIGSYIINYKRSDTLPFDYEVQWYAMTMQLGFTGVLLFCAALLSLLLSHIALRRNAVFFYPVFILWFFSGFTNPFITSLGSAFGLCILMIRCNFPVDNGRHTLAATRRYPNRTWRLLPQAAFIFQRPR